MLIQVSCIAVNDVQAEDLFLALFSLVRSRSDVVRTGAHTAVDNV